MDLLTYNTLIVLAGATLLGVNAGLVGSFAVLRGRALLGDVLGHAALPGLCLSFLLLGRRSLPHMLLGALAACLIAVLLMTLLRRFTRVKDDAVMGVARSIFFGLGIVLVSIVQNTVTEGSKAGLDSYILGKTAGMLRSDVVLMAGVSAASLATIALLFKELRLAAFDPGFARVQGWPAGLLDNLQMTLVAVTTVAGLPAVGAILVAAMLILPAATMRFWTDRLGPLLIGAAIIGGLVGASGTLLSARYSMLPAGPIIILAGTFFFVASMFVAPRRGLTARYWADRRFRGELHERKLLTTLFELSERQVGAASGVAVGDVAAAREWTDRDAARFLAQARGDGLVEPVGAPMVAGGEVRLTEEGRRRAARLVRGERLWAAYLDEFPEESGPGAPFDLEELEAAIPPDVRERLSLQLRTAGRLPDDGAGRRT
jgi:manganese/zinc/iron transport system permease protein